MVQAVPLQPDPAAPALAVQAGSNPPNLDDLQKILASSPSGRAWAARHLKDVKLGAHNEAGADEPDVPADQLASDEAAAARERARASVRELQEKLDVQKGILQSLDEDDAVFPPPSTDIPTPSTSVPEPSSFLALAGSEPGDALSFNEYLKADIASKNPRLNRDYKIAQAVKLAKAGLPLTTEDARWLQFADLPEYE